MEALVSKQGGLAHGSGAVEILFQKVSENRLADRRSGRATEGAAGQPKERRGNRRSGRETPKGVCGQRRGLGALGLK